ncbi:MAG TPA: hypothetical protein VN713_00405 [Sphingomicrobium sp.]|nr:hypothetical protein [Sphingomicrobium sp.]
MDRTPAGNEVLDFTPHLLPQDLLAALGLMAASAAQTEDIIEMAIAGILGIDGERGYAVTCHMSAPLRASVLKSAAEIRFDDPAILDELDLLLDRIKLTQGYRNDMLHGSWCRRPSDGAIFLVSQEARTHVEIKSRPVTVDEIELKADALYEAGIDLMSFLIDLNVVPETPRERKRGVNTPKSRKARKKNGK